MIAFIIIIGLFIFACAFLGWVAAVVEDRAEKREEKRKESKRA